MSNMPRGDCCTPEKIVKRSRRGVFTDLTLLYRAELKGVVYACRLSAQEQAMGLPQSTLVDKRGRSIT